MPRRGLMIALVSAALFHAGCDRRESPRPAAPAPPVATQPAVAAPQGPRVIFLGDSLTAGLGVPADEAYPALVARALEKTGTPILLVNAGVSGDTTAGGLSRLDWMLKQKPAVIVVALGSNDGMRAVKIDAIESNLRQILTRCGTAGVRVLLLGMRLPPNYGEPYVSDFAAIYPRLASELNVPFVPFLLEGVGGDVSLNQADGIHPTAAGHQRLASTVEDALRRVLTAPK